MSTLTEYSGLLVVERCWCGIQHAVPKSLVDEQSRHHTNGLSPITIYCPLGHGWIRSGKGEAEKLREQLADKDREIQSERAGHDQTRAELRETERRRRAEKGAKTKLKKRAANGLCPCCNRYFANVHRHMGHMHPEFKQEVLVESKSE